jgi:hypothetical protein
MIDIFIFVGLKPSWPFDPLAKASGNLKEAAFLDSLLPSFYEVSSLNKRKVELSLVDRRIG